jgi:Raf kinase inhibitor-like YbhB/YbcL family protein
LKLTSQAFAEGAEIPQQYTCRGDNVSPPLSIVGVPQNAKSLALIMHDLDAVSGDFLHWLMWDIPTATTSIASNSVPVGAFQGPSGTGEPGYMGPCPPKGTGTHHYKFELYALDTTLNLDAKSGHDKLVDAMQDRILDKSTLTGLFSAEN